MIDRTDLQLMLCEEIMEMDTTGLIELTEQLMGEDLEIHNPEDETMTGSIETINITDARELRKWLGFLIYALGERVNQNEDDDEPV